MQEEQASVNTLHLHFFHFTVVFEVFLPLDLQVRLEHLVLGFGGDVLACKRREIQQRRARRFGWISYQVPWKSRRRWNLQRKALRIRQCLARESLGRGQSCCRRTCHSHKKDLASVEATATVNGDERWNKLQNR